ncbi:ARF-like protein [Mya arenaria]|uniref:ARF-like protein n=1 Tax=Mya arenaria TaxID=6604 RepID=A0ABY7FCW6_MYAAR|nr:uncharacterized protein LOC128209235 [Mya arenaria]WAR18621.1 ARF-like protein [Mya arenaria]
MGLFIAKLYSLFDEWGNNPARIIMLGLDAAGKTTVLYKLKLNETVSTIPTIGFNVETVSPVKGLKFTVWDIGGQSKIRPLWRQYFKDADGLIYVVDSCDRSRMAEAREELFGILESEEMRSVPVVVLANKQDLTDALEPSGIIDALCLRQLTDRKWYVKGTSARTGDGLFEGVEQLATLVNDFKQSYRSPP